MGKLVIVLSILLAVGKFRSSTANTVLNMQRTLKDQRDKESSLPSCDRKKEDICHKDTKELYKGANGQCQQHSCLFQPTVGLTQHPHTPYFKFNPSAIVSSAKTILYSFKGMEGEVCTYQKQPCSCRREDKCSCSSAAKICKQQYKVERTYFVVYNSGKKSYKSPYGAPAGHKPNMGFNPGYAQHQASPFGLGMMGMMGMNPFQQSYGSQQQSPPQPTGLNIMGLGRSLVPKDNEDKKSNENEGNKRNLGPLFPNALPSTNPGMPFPSESGNSEMQKLQALVQSLSMNQGPNGFPMGMMPPGPPSQGFGSYNPYQMPSPQGPASMPQQPSYPFPPNTPPHPLPQQSEFGNHPAPQDPGFMPQQPSHPAFPPNMPPHPMPQQSEFGNYQGQHPQGYPIKGPMPAQFPPQLGPSPPHPSSSNEFQNYPNNPPQSPPANPGSSFPQNPNPFQPESPPNTPSESGEFGTFNGQPPQGYPNAHQSQSSTFDPAQSYPQQPQMNVPHGPNPYSPFHQAPHSPPNQQYPPHHQSHSMGSQRPVSMYGNAMMTSAIFRYFLMQDKSTTTSNTFLKMLPILMSNSQLSKMISFESLYVMVPDGCDCEQSNSNDNDDDSKQNNRYPFFNPFQYPSSMMSGYQMPHSPFPSYGAQPSMPFPAQYPGMNPTLGHPGMVPPPPPASGNSAPWFMNYQIFKGKPSAFGQ